MSPMGSANANASANMISNDDDELFFEKWKLKITFSVNHPPKDVYQFLVNDLYNSNNRRPSANQMKHARNYKQNYGLAKQISISI
jgi:hypothetical protein